ncbi:hypothetical protein C8R44DRAFT_759603 [Mycena epipterygia]|nr:hypothetical protein C8R44DRAFT_759603 [Mycena epipterygia]
MDLFEARSILTHCSQLTRCKMPNVRPADDEEPDLPMCVLTTLSSFEFGAWEYGITSPFFQPFSFPNLRFLTIEAGAWPDNLLLDLHARSGFNLTRLSLVNLELGADALITFLRLVPSLTVLFLRNADCVTNRLFEAFTCDASSKSTEITLPLLQLLMLQQFVNHLEGETVVRMVESLWGHRDTADAAFPSLRRIQFAMIGSRFSDDVESRLAKICATGFLNDFYKRSAPV